MEQAIIRAKNILPVQACEQYLLRFLFIEINQDDVVGFLRKLPDRVAAYISSLGIVERCDLMRDIMNTEIRVDLKKLASDGAGDIILKAEVGS